MTDIIIVEDEAIAAQHLQRILQDIFEETENGKRRAENGEFPVVPESSQFSVLSSQLHFTILQSIEETVDYFSNKRRTESGERRTELPNSEVLSSQFSVLNCPKPDLVFMDFHLADGLATHIFEHTSIPCPVIFTTAYDQYALDAFRAGGIDYLLKPIDHDAVRHALEKISKIENWKKKRESKTPNGAENGERRTESGELGAAPGQFSVLSSQFPTPKTYPSHFLIPLRNKLIPVEVRQIACIHLEDKITRAILYDGRQQIIDRPLDALMDQLDPAVFFRANRQYIVAHRAIDDIAVWPISKLAVTLSVATPERIIISKARVHEFKQWYTK